MTPEQAKALEEYRRYVQEYTNGNPDLYQTQGSLSMDQLGDSAMEGIETDPRYREAEMAALRELEGISQNGFTASDLADIQRTEQLANRANRGRIESIRQGMQMRGQGGGGLDLVAQLQSAQDANEMQALKALEREGMMQDRKTQGTMQLGSLSSQLQGRDFNQQSAKAQARDAINQFNVQNRNRANEYNMQNRQNVANANVDTRNQFRDKRMQAQTGMATMNYDAATDDYNQAQMRKAERKRKQAGMMSGIVGAAGGIAGGVLGSAAGPLGTAAGASAGYQAGSALGGAMGGYAKGGRVPGMPPFPGTDSPMNDILMAPISPGEVVIPESISDDPIASAKFVAAQNQGMDPMASKYLANDSYEMAPPPIEAPKPKASPAPASMKLAAKPAPKAIPEPILAKLAQKNPSLVEQYRAKMGAADQGVQNAEDMQGYLGLANVVGKGLTDFSNSQKDNVILANRMGDLGKAPTVVEAERKEYDGSAVDRLGQMGVDRAKDARNREDQGFFRDQQISQMDKTAALDDPGSAESASARAFMKSLLPNAAKIEGFEGMSASRLEKAYGPIMAKWQAERAQANADREYSLRERTLNAKTGSSAADAAGGDLLKGIPPRLWDNAIREKKSIEEHNKVSRDAFGSVNQMAQIDLVNANTPSWLGGEKEKYENLRANISAAVVGRVPGVRSDKDYENIVVPMLPQPGDTRKAAMDRVRKFEGWLASQAPETPTLSNYGRGVEGITGLEASQATVDSEMVPIQAPNGKVKMIPSSQVEAAIRAGGKRVQ